MILKTRHFAIMATAAVTVAAMFNNIPLADLVGFFTFMGIVIAGDKALSLKK